MSKHFDHKKPKWSQKPLAGFIYAPTGLNFPSARLIYYLFQSYLSPLPAQSLTQPLLSLTLTALIFTTASHIFIPDFLYLPLRLKGFHKLKHHCLATGTYINRYKN